MTKGLNRRPLRIGICAPYDLGRAGGVNSHIRAQARALRERGHYVRVFGASSGPLSDGERTLSGCVWIVIGGTETPIGFDPRAWWRVRRLFQRERFDIVHIHEPLMPLVPWCAVWRADQPIAATFHTHREHGHRFYPAYRPLLAPLMDRISLRIAVSDAARRTVEAHFPGDYVVIPNGIDVARFQPPMARPAQMQPPRRYVLFVGRLEPRKGVTHLIDAMATVQRRVPDAQLIIVGEGPDRPTLEQRARDAHVDVEFARYLEDDSLPAYYQAADVVCCPSTHDESFGIVLLEAMAAGRPVVASQINGFLELVGELHAGVSLVPPSDSEALARELVALLEDPPRRERLAAAGRTFAARFDWSAVAQALEAEYLRLLDGMATSGRKEYGSSGLNTSDASDKFDRPLMR